MLSRTSFPSSFWPTSLRSEVTRSFRSGHGSKHSTDHGLSGRLRAMSTRHPFITNCLSLGCLYGSAELSQQMLYHMFRRQQEKAHSSDGEERPHELALDWSSLKRYFFMGSCVLPLLYHPWYKWLDSAFRGTRFRTVLAKTVLDSFLLGPPVSFIFFVGMNLLEGKSDVLSEFKEKFFLTFYSACCFWMPIQALNFWLIKPRRRIAFMGAAAFVWLNFLCIIKNLDQYEQQQ